jgi:hypothetical protein
MLLAGKLMLFLAARREPQLTSHETVCILNTSDTDAEIMITIYYSDSKAGGPYCLMVPARRTKHVRFNNLNDSEPIPRETDFASIIESDVPSLCSTPAAILINLKPPCSALSRLRAATDRHV